MNKISFSYFVCLNFFEKSTSPFAVRTFCYFFANFIKTIYRGFYLVLILQGLTLTHYFDEILYTAADFELDERHVIKNANVALDRLRVLQNVFLVIKPNQSNKIYLLTKIMNNNEKRK